MKFTLNGYMPINVVATIEAKNEEEARELFREELEKGLTGYVMGSDIGYTPVSDMVGFEDTTDLSAYRDEDTIIEDVE